MNWRCRKLVALALSGMAAGQAAAQSDSSAREPIPEHAFASRDAAASQGLSAASTPVRKALPANAPASMLFAAPPPEVDTSTAFSDLLNAQKTPPPFYRRWLDALVDIVAPDEPYRRDKLTLVLGTSVGYDNNVLYSPIDPIASATAGFHGAADYHFGSRRMKLDASLTGGVTYYENRPGGSSDQNYALKLALDYKLMQRLAFSFNTFTAYLSQPSPQVIGGLYQYSGSYFYTNTAMTLNYQMRPRFGLSLSYAFTGLKYDDEFINEGSGYYQENYTIGGNWLVTPRTAFLLQYRYNPVHYYESGISSTGQILLVGLQQSLSPRLNYTLLGGVEHRTLENPSPDNPGSYMGPFVEGTLNYQFAPRSSLNGTLHFGTEPSGTQGVTIRTTFRASLGVSHSLGSRLTLDGNLGFERDNYDQPGVITDYTQDIYTASLALRYNLALFTYVVLRDDYLLLGTTLPDGGYSRNAVSLGLEVQF